MTWTSIFDLGECTVSAEVSGVGTILSAVMTKGDTQSITFNGNDGEVSVSADGVVTMSGDNTDFGGTVTLYVEPTDVPYGPDNPLPGRVRDITLNISTRGTNEAICAVDSHFNQNQITLSGSGSSWTPDPCESLVNGEVSEFYVYGQASGV